MPRKSGVFLRRLDAGTRAVSGTLGHMVARLQRWMVFGWLAALVVWLIFQWPWPPWITLAGVFVLLFGHAALLALEFAATYVVSRNDAVGRATAIQCARAWLAESLVAPRVFGWYQPFRSRAIPDRLPRHSQRGVVLVHGFLCNRGFWHPWLEKLRAADRPFVAVDLEPVFGSIDDYVPIIDDAIIRMTEATGHPPLLLCHSMGGLAARAWLRCNADTSRVHRIVTIGTPHGGTWLARFAYSLNSRQMRVDADWLRGIQDTHTGTQRVPFTCWFSNTDNMVFPASVSTLPGADNRLVPGRGHIEMAFDPRVMRETLELLAH